MSFADEIRKEKSSELTEKEYNDMLNSEAIKYRKNDISDVSSTLIQMIKDGFHRAKPEEDYRENFWGKRVLTGKKVVKTDIQIDRVYLKYNGRIRYECVDCDEYYINVIYADKKAIREIESNMKSWLNSNEIIVEDVKVWGQDGFRYWLKMYL